MLFIPSLEWTDFRTLNPDTHTTLIFYIREQHGTTLWQCENLVLLIISLNKGRSSSELWKSLPLAWRFCCENIFNNKIWPAFGWTYCELLARVIDMPKSYYNCKESSKAPSNFIKAIHCLLVSDSSSLAWVIISLTQICANKPHWRMCEGRLLLSWNGRA